MGMNIRVDGLMVAAILVAGVGVAIYLNRKAISDAADKLNPVSNNNVAYTTASAITNTLTQGRDKTLGDYWYRKCSEQGFRPWYCPSVK